MFDAVHDIIFANYLSLRVLAMNQRQHRYDTDGFRYHWLPVDVAIGERALSRLRRDPERVFLKMFKPIEANKGDELHVAETVRRGIVPDRADYPYMRGGIVPATGYRLVPEQADQSSEGSEKWRGTVQVEFFEYGDWDKYRYPEQNIIQLEADAENGAERWFGVAQLAMSGLHVAVLARSQRDWSVALDIRELKPNG